MSRVGQATLPQTRQLSGQAPGKHASVSENVAADILGHERLRITHGLYSGGTSLTQKREALAKLVYPMPEKERLPWQANVNLIRLRLIAQW